MPDKSKRELKRELEDIRATRPVDFEVTSSVQTIMDREQAHAEDREILDDASDGTRIVTWTDADGEVIGGSSKARPPDGVDLVVVATE